MNGPTLSAAAEILPQALFYGLLIACAAAVIACVHARVSIECQCRYARGYLDTRGCPLHDVPPLESGAASDAAPGQTPTDGSAPDGEQR